MQKPRNVLNVADAKQKIPDLEVFGNGNLFQLLSKASSQSAGFMKSCKAMETPAGCLVQVSTEIDGIPAEALSFVPGVRVGKDENGDPALVAID